MMKMKKYRVFGAFLALSCVGFAGEKEDAQLVAGIRSGDAGVVQEAIQHGARLDQQLNDSGQTPLTLAQQLFAEAEEEGDGLDAIYERIIRMLTEPHVAPVVAHMYPVERNESQHYYPGRIHPHDVNVLLMLAFGDGDDDDIDCGYGVDRASF